MTKHKNRSVQILSMGSYLPKKKVFADELDKKLGKKSGWVFDYSGVHTRYYVDDETAAQMGATACKRALENAERSIEDIECIICASGSMQQIIPCTASLILEELKCNTNPACFDINSTCLSFATGLDIAASLLDNGRYSNCLLVSSEVASKNLNWDAPKGAILFGDGAVCALLNRASANENSFVGTSLFHTYPEGAHFAEIKVGSNLPAREYCEDRKADFLFKMDGPAVYLGVLEHIHDFLKEFEQLAERSIKSYSAVIPHQGSGLGLQRMQKRLKISDQRFINIIHDYGNMIAASIPLALHLMIESGRIQRGDHVLLLGGGAGLGMGIVELCY
ncbi:3-oxoacyl-[acyl-carrier-protein] synthase III C-terminal domain-containing protein [Candidatus Haliotispira prima]|uniref:3-oxoacyl-[acyl-carrier-protein] synthase III C-terminal domain-containing protein n=1 Tax=Candidatus Haliotispira prima TaxID=3034016 RepID=A0ABY8MI75_9SPIO|nr:3-oxoacyl-[acyl-carrier-protein] synthase III C-terminal domain-containing protein [Candidatus Haliotispira prima]